jgi:hypothetical protein
MRLPHERVHAVLRGFEITDRPKQMPNDPAPWARYEPFLLQGEQGERQLEVCELGLFTPPKGASLFLLTTDE